MELISNYFVESLIKAAMEYLSSVSEISIMHNSTSAKKLGLVQKISRVIQNDSVNCGKSTKLII